MTYFLEPPHFADPKQDPWMTQILFAGLQSGHRGTYELACILTGRKDLIPCKGCDFVPTGCRCEGKLPMDEVKAAAGFVKHTLSEADMHYLVSTDWPDEVWHETEPKQIKFTPDPERQKLLDGFGCYESHYYVEMDNHGVNIHVYVYDEGYEGAPMLGFLWGASSEEHFFGKGYFNRTGEQGSFLVSANQIAKVEYKRTDGRDFTT